MNMEQKINRINELYHKSKTSQGLTEEEKKEQAKLRQEYIANIRGNLQSQLESIQIVEKDGSVTKVSKSAKDAN